MIINACFEKNYLKKTGIECNGCMSQEIIEIAISEKLNPSKKNNLRDGCNCLMGNDVGAYDTCGRFCKYCYANSNVEAVKENMKMHNPNSSFLVGDVITEARK